MSDYQVYINVIGGAALGALGWFAKTLWDNMTRQRADFDAHRVEVAKDYVSKADFKAALDSLTQEMREGFNRLFDKLDAKQDK